VEDAVALSTQLPGRKTSKPVTAYPCIDWRIRLYSEFEPASKSFPRVCSLIRGKRAQSIHGFPSARNLQVSVPSVQPVSHPKTPVFRNSSHAAENNNVTSIFGEQKANNSRETNTLPFCPVLGLSKTKELSNTLNRIREEQRALGQPSARGASCQSTIQANRPDRISPLAASPRRSTFNATNKADSCCEIGHRP
jgi:hypothetical protein